jgi:hypothetical protein
VQNKLTPEDQKAGEKAFKQAVARGFATGELFTLANPLTEQSTAADINRAMAKASELLAEAFAVTEGALFMVPAEHRQTAALAQMHVGLHAVADAREKSGSALTQVGNA